MWINRRSPHRYKRLYNDGVIVTSYSDARANLASLMDRATEDREEVRITRQGRPDVMLVAAEEWEGWKETVYLLRSPANAQRLLAALERAYRGEGDQLTLDELRRESGLAPAEG
jgi:antitoxin YefM